MLTKENAHKEFEGWLNRCRAANIDIKAILQASGLRTDRGFHKADGAKPPKPVVFDTLQAFHGALQHARPSAESFFAMRSDTIKALVAKSVEGNTFRAFHLRARGHHPGPASLYRQIVGEILNNSLGQLSGIDSQDDFDRFIYLNACRVEAAFDQAAGEAGFMGFGRAAKLFSLSMKFFLRHTGIGDEDRTRLLGYLHVPLDSFTLQGIRRLYPDLKIPRDARMGWAPMNEWSKYLAVQRWIRAEARCVGVPAIYYDIAAWDLAH